MVKWWYGDMVKWVIRVEIIVPFLFPCTITILKKENLEGYFKRAVLNSSSLVVGCTDDYLYSIWGF